MELCSFVFLKIEVSLQGCSTSSDCYVVVYIYLLQNVCNLQILHKNNGRPFGRALLFSICVNVQSNIGGHCCECYVASRLP